MAHVVVSGSEGRGSGRLVAPTTRVCVSLGGRHRRFCILNRRRPQMPAQVARVMKDRIDA
jgi:hypothetical protein